ncbi:MAG: DUF4926 domain-containing protein [Chloroflexi bacterium]|nr:DUF4926 domain-containing protein [Chloroflexota bacterium]
MTTELREHEQIVLTAVVRDDEGKCLYAGDVGKIIHIHPEERAFVVEFMAQDGETAAIATVLPSQARPVTRADHTDSQII